MRPGDFRRFLDPPDAYDAAWVKQTLGDLEAEFRSIHQALDSLGFGDGVDTDNLVGKWIQYATNAAADTEDTIAHSLGVIPIGVIVMVPPQAGFIYKGTTAWTTTNIYLKCSAADQDATLFLVVPSHGLLV